MLEWQAGVGKDIALVVIRIELGLGCASSQITSDQVSVLTLARAAKTEFRG